MTKSYIRLIIGALVSVCCALGVHGAQAAGTPAGTVISNRVTVDFSYGGIAGVAASNTATVTVAEVINVSLTWQDAAAVAVNSPDTSRALTLLLTNTGNGSEPFSLTRNNSISGDQFDPANAAIGAIFLENGAEAGFQASGANADTLYIPGNNDPLLAADASRTVYLVSDIPTNLAQGNTAQASLNAVALTSGAAGAAPGTRLSGLGAGGVDALVGASRATATATGSYVISGLSVAVFKRVSAIQAPYGDDPNRIMPGTVLTYIATVRVSGAGTATNLAFNDPLPAETDFVPGSILVNGTARTDAADADNTDFNVGSKTINVRFGDTVAPTTHLIEFRVKVK